MPVTASTPSPQPQMPWLVCIFTNRPPPEYPHFISVIFKSEGGDNIGVRSIAVSRPLPKDVIGAKGARAAASVVLDKNDLLEFNMSRFFAFE